MLCERTCEREYVHGCMAFSGGCHHDCWNAVRNDQLRNARCASGCRPTWLMMTARCGMNPDASPTAEMARNFDAQVTSAMSSLVAERGSPPRMSATPQATTSPAVRFGWQQNALEPLARNLPRNGRCAVVLRGHSFREPQNHAKRWGISGVAGCELRAKEPQLQAIQSVLNNIVLPLEWGNNIVHVYWQESSGKCTAIADAVHKYGRRIKAVDSTTISTSQSSSMRIALDLLRRASPHSVARYDLILLTRHDLVWRTPIFRWNADFRHMTLLTQMDGWAAGEVAALGRAGPAVSDVLYSLPGKLFDAFDREVGRDMCFVLPEHAGPSRPGRWWNLAVGSGHGCFDQLARIDRNISFACFEPGEVRCPARSIQQRSEACVVDFM